MKSILLGMGLVLFASDSYAISRYNAALMSCGEVRARIAREGAAIVRYRSARTGQQLYGRYVLDDRFCASSERPETTYITTRDTNSCPVDECRPYDIDDDYLLFRHR